MHADFPVLDGACGAAFLLEAPSRTSLTLNAPAGLVTIRSGAPFATISLSTVLSQEQAKVRKRRGKQRLKLERVPLHECQTINEVWSMDFVSDSLASGRRIKCLTVTDDFSHECVDIAVDHGIGGEYVVRVLDQVARFRGCPCLFWSCPRRRRLRMSWPTGFRPNPGW